MNTGYSAAHFQPGFGNISSQFNLSFMLPIQARPHFGGAGKDLAVSCYSLHTKIIVHQVRLSHKSFKPKRTYSYSFE